MPTSQDKNHETFGYGPQHMVSRYCRRSKIENLIHCLCKWEIPCNVGHFSSIPLKTWFCSRPIYNHDLRSSSLNFAISRQHPKSNLHLYNLIIPPSTGTFSSKSTGCRMEPSYYLYWERFQCFRINIHIGVWMGVVNRNPSPWRRMRCIKGTMTRVCGLEGGRVARDNVFRVTEPTLKCLGIGKGIRSTHVTIGTFAIDDLDDHDDRSQCRIRV